MTPGPLTVAWFSFFPVEWLSGAPEVIRRLPARHPASWQRVLVNELKAIPDLRLHVIELRKELERDCHFNWNGIDFHCLKVPRRWRATSLFWVDTWLIARQLRRIRPDVVHAWGTEYGAALVASRLKYPALVSLQGLLEYFVQVLPMDGYNRLAARLERASLRRARVASAESAFSVDWLRRHYPHLDLHHVEHAPGWEFYQVERKPETNPLHFLTVGSISWRKGPDLLLAALDQLRHELDFRLTMVGFAAEPGLVRDLRANTSPELWQRINIIEKAPAEQLLDLYSKATMVILPTRADTGPVAVKEAAVAGVPVIGSVVGGIPDYVKPGLNGILIPPGDAAALVQAVRDACAHPLFRQGRVDSGSLAAVREHLSPRRMADQFLGLYRRLSQPPRPA